jgi:hypothetical protein
MEYIRKSTIWLTANIQTAPHCVADNEKITIDYKILKVDLLDKDGGNH